MWHFSLQHKHKSRDVREYLLPQNFLVGFSKILQSLLSWLSGPDPWTSLDSYASACDEFISRDVDFVTCVTYMSFCGPYLLRYFRIVYCQQNEKFCRENLFNERLSYHRATACRSVSLENYC